MRLFQTLFSCVLAVLGTTPAHVPDELPSAHVPETSYGAVSGPHE